MNSPEAVRAAAKMSVRFWGVRGTFPCPSADVLRYGGNTSCVEIRCGEHVLIFDAGTGIRLLGEALVKDRRATEIDLFLSHYHIDHIMGLPFFAPLHVREYTVRVWGSHNHPAAGVEHVLRKLMSEPLFPVPIGDLAARLEFRDFHASDTLSPRQGITIRTAPLSHPGSATGYRIDYSGRSVAYLTDTEFPDGVIDPGVVALAQDADLLILDCSFTDDELPMHVGWGHSSWQQGIKMANAANVKRLCLFHHDPSHNDVFMDGIAKAAEAARAGTMVAREGWYIDL